ncbi:Uncharacterised protein [Mycobacteroides abscessus subsp. bolletii]|uniref:hypothetical protein n=2 Tax=Mycobacteroides abscessus TaxID=36809 RepID=UPI00092B3000|nr:hypothetical protein [Mycobacteroides abscessus]SHP62441.1 Uncharacterised protein [Mycobacteroides abscessus subsp. bolletii]SHR47538.1 Uncharacterised protein [Mycobacteroides abscessus subsp. bolletii]SHS10659.1 Uncharacterised protein [Mycobacteroides abscessus subsp. bolletii]SHS25320.1 Uncharacterised protein [Mycobacteroides abscessus subsp. bolletii]SHY52907.1 Uncharacterised protein [Mycobacteroides abscessus subsp. bolletii]
MSEHPRQYKPRPPRPNAARGPVVAAYADKIDYPCEHCHVEPGSWCKTPHGTDAIAPCWNRGAKVGAR